MANICTNTVTFKGNAADIKDLKDIFNKISEEQSKDNLGKTLMDSPNPDYIFDLMCVDYGDEESFVVIFNTKWTPCIKPLIHVVENKDVSFSLWYEEGLNVVGGVDYYSGLINHKYIDDVSKLRYNEEEAVYEYKLGNQVLQDVSAEALLENILNKI